MKKQIIFGLILVGGLILLGAGCAAGRRAEPAETQTNTNGAANENVNQGAGEENVNAVEPGVTEEDLNQLKLEINGMEYEDLNALTK